MIDTKFLCRSIYQAAFVAVTNNFTGAPVAYINIRCGENPIVNIEEIVKKFNEVKWNTPLAAADLRFIKDKNVSDTEFEIENLEEFQDDEGNVNKLPVHQEDKIIKLN